MPDEPIPTALVVDDEPQIRRLLTVTLEGNGYRVLAVENGREALVMAAQYHPDVMLLDLGLPDLEGHLVLKRLREWSNTPVIILTVKDSPVEKIAALDAGADDFVTKPFHGGELLARMRAAMRHRATREEPSVFKSGDLVIDLASRQVKRRREEVKLTATEYSLLRLLTRHAGKVLTHQQILKEVWGPGNEGRTHYLRVYMAHLREKLEPNPTEPTLLLTEPGVGYRFAGEPAEGQKS
jgi:two-component system KDP operon response regulator KdpE